MPISASSMAPAEIDIDSIFFKSDGDTLGLLLLLFPTT